MPKVSVITPSYNQADFIQETLLSIVNQSFKDWEHVIVDDGSTDNTVEIINNFVARQVDASKYTVIVQENKGPAAARNAAIAAAKGEYIMPLDADDTLHPLCLEKMARVLSINPAISIVGSNTQRFGEANEPYGTGEFMEQVINPHGNSMNYASMFRKSVWETVGGYVTSDFEDWDFWIRCARQKFKLRHLPELLFNYRVRTGSRLDSYSNSPEKLGNFLAGHNIK